MKGFNAMFRFAYANQNNTAASAMCAEAASSCTFQSSRFNCIALGAIIMASIIITLVTLIGLNLVSNLALVIFLLALVLVLVMLENNVRLGWERAHNCLDRNAAPPKAGPFFCINSIVKRRNER